MRIISNFKTCRFKVINVMYVFILLTLTVVHATVEDHGDPKEPRREGKSKKEAFFMSKIAISRIRVLSILVLITK